MTRLSLVPPLNEGETLPSYCSRIAAMHGYSASEFGRMLDFNFARVCDEKGEDLACFAYLAGIDDDDLEHRRLPWLGHWSRRLLGEPFAANSLSWGKVCPHCLAHDEASGSGRRGCRAFARLHWLPDFVLSCPEHETVLAELPSERSPRHGDLITRLNSFPGGIDALRQASGLVGTSKFQRYALARIEGRSVVDTWMNRLALQEVALLIRGIGISVTGDLKSLTAAESKIGAYNVGFDMIVGDEEECRRFLRTMVAKRAATPTPIAYQTRLGAIDGKHDDLFRFAGFENIAEMVWQSSIEATGQALFPLVPRTAQQTWLEDLSQKYRLPFTVVRRAMEHAGLIPQSVERWRAGSIPIDKVQAQEILDPVGENLSDSRAPGWMDNSRRIEDTLEMMSAEDLAEKLEVSLPVISALVSDGFLSAVVIRRGRHILVVRQSAEDFMLRYSSRPQNKQDIPGITEYEVGSNFYLRG